MYPFQRPQCNMCSMFGGCMSSNQPMQMKRKKKNKPDPYMNMIRGQIMLERFKQAKDGKKEDKKKDDPPKPWYRSMSPWELGAILFLVGMIVSPMFVVYMVSNFKHSMEVIQQLAR